MLRSGPSTSGEASWTPVLNFATPGDVSIAYSVQTGSYTKVGRIVVANFVVTCVPTFTTASGAATLSGLPFAAGALGPFHGALNWSGITKAAYTNVVCRVGSNVSVVDFRAAASAQTTSAIVAADIPTGGTLVLAGTIVYFA